QMRAHLKERILGPAGSSCGCLGHGKYPLFEGEWKAKRRAYPGYGAFGRAEKIEVSTVQMAKKPAQPQKNAWMGISESKIPTMKGPKAAIAEVQPMTPPA